MANGLFFAEPPFESDEFQSYRESDPNRQPVLLDGGQTVNVDLVLQGSNFRAGSFSEETSRPGSPKYNLWAMLKFGFSKTTMQTVNPISTIGSMRRTPCSMKRSVIPMTRASSPEVCPRWNLFLETGPAWQDGFTLPKPITFQLKNPDQEIKIGNAVKLEWSTNKKVDKFGVRRKVKSSDESYKTVFSSDSDRLEPDATSYVDNGITPGISYQYRVVAIDTASNTGENLGGDALRFPTQSFIWLPKQIREWFRR